MRDPTCDRCGARMAGDPYAVSYSLDEGPLNVPMAIDLCRDCTVQFAGWMGEGVKRPGRLRFKSWAEMMEWRRKRREELGELTTCAGGS